MSEIKLSKIKEELQSELKKYGETDGRFLMGKGKSDIYEIGKILGKLELINSLLNP